MFNFSWRAKTFLLILSLTLLATLFGLVLYFLAYKNSSTKEQFYTVTQDGKMTINSIDEHGRQKKITDFSAGFFISISPDKRWIVYTKSNDSLGNSQVYFRNLENSKEQLLSINNQDYLFPGTNFVWSLDGKQALLISRTKDQENHLSSNLALLNLNNGQVQNIEISDKNALYAFKSATISFIKSTSEKVYLMAHYRYLDYTYFVFDWKTHLIQKVSLPGNSENQLIPRSENWYILDVDSTGNKLLVSNGGLWERLRSGANPTGKLQIYDAKNSTTNILMSRSGYAFPLANFINKDLILYAESPVPTSAQSATIGFKNPEKWYLLDLTSSKKKEVLSVNDDQAYSLSPFNEKTGLIQYLSKDEYRLDRLDFSSGSILNIYKSNIHAQIIKLF